MNFYKMRNLSIIIPVYNVEPFIRSTLDSVYNQKVDEQLFEVIVVNDGSPDNSMDIVDEFAALHSNLTIINQDNQGLSCARNAGIKNAVGKYVWVVDSDDMITDHSIKEALHEIEKSPDVDIFCFNLYEKRGNSLTPTCLSSKAVYQQYYGEIHDGFSYCRKLPTGVCQKFLFRKGFLEENDLEFTPGIYHEDQDFLIRCYTKAKRILPLQNIWYVYNIRESGSITSTFKIKRFHDLLWIVKNFRMLSDKSNDFKERTILEEGVFSLTYGLLNSKYRNNQEFKDFLKENIKLLKSLLFSSYFRSIRKNSLGKSWRLLKTII